MPTAERPNRQIILAERPTGKLEERHFRLTEATIGEPAPGEALCRTILISIDAANRAWMQGRTYREQLQAGDIMAGGNISEVIAVNGAATPVGSIVMCEAGWQEYANLPAARLMPINPSGKDGELTHHLSVLG